jgi:hypothetical protein
MVIRPTTSGIITEAPHGQILVRQFSDKFEILLPENKKTFKGLRGGR